MDSKALPRSTFSHDVGPREHEMIYLSSGCKGCARTFLSNKLKFPRATSRRSFMLFLTRFFMHIVTYCTVYVATGAEIVPRLL